MPWSRGAGQHHVRARPRTVPVAGRGDDGLRPLAEGANAFLSSKILSDRDLAQIQAYLAAVPASPDADSIALLGGASTASSSKDDSERGQQVYVARCASCHGASGGGAVGPSLVDVAKRRGVSGIESFVRNPSGAMPKLFPEVLTESDVQAVAQYVARLR
jgi:ubiquinol-cytochrome c reductase cytochrome c subunit